MIISSLTVAYLMGPGVTATLQVVASQPPSHPKYPAKALCEDPISAVLVATDSAPSHTVYIV